MGFILMIRNILHHNLSFISPSYVLSCFSCVQLFVTPWIVACQAPLSLAFSRQEYWSGLLFLSPRDLPDPGIQLKFFCISIGRFFGSDSKASAYNVGDLGSIPVSRRSPGEGNGNPLQYSCLENARDRGAWWAAVYWITQSWTLDTTEAT